MNEIVKLRYVALFTAVVLSTLSVVFLAWQFSSVVALVLVSVAVAAMVRAPVEWLIKRRVPQGLAMAVIYATGLLVICGVSWFVLPRVSVEMQGLTQDFNKSYADYIAKWMSGSVFQQNIARRLPSGEALNGMLAGGASSLAPLIMGATLNVFEMLTQSLLVIFLSLYWSADKLRVERLILSLISPEHRTQARQGWREIETGLGAYLRGEMAQVLLAGAMLTFIFSLLGMKYPVTRALLASLAWLLPLVGGIVALIPVLVIGLFINPFLGVVATGFAIAVFAFLEFVVERKLYPRERYGSVLVLLITIVMVESLGITGLLIAPPLAAALQIALTEWLRPAPAAPVDPIGGLPLEGIKTRMATIQEVLLASDSPSPRTVNLLGRLNTLVTKIEAEVDPLAPQ